MATTSFPFEDQDTTETQFSALFRELQDTGVVGAFGSASLRVTADSTGMNVKVAPGSAIVRGHMFVSTDVETLVIPAASAQARVDLVVLRLDPAANAITLEVKSGAPAASNPAPPALTRTDTGVFEEPLAQVAVAASTATIAAGAVADRRRYVGQRLGTWDSDTRPAAPRAGQLGLNMSTGRWEYRDGSVWTDLLRWASISSKPATFSPSAHTHSAGDITSGTLAVARIPDLPASRIASGTLDLARIPAIPYSKLDDRPFHSRTTGVTVGLGGTVRQVTFPSGRFSGAPATHVSMVGATSNMDMLRIGLTGVTSTYAEYTIFNDSSTARTVAVNVSAFPVG